MHGKVTTWYMSEEERLAYIEKHPIIPTEKPSSYASLGEQLKKKGEIGRKRIKELHDKE